MERIINLTEARSQLPALVKAAAESDELIVISTRNEPKALLIGYQAFQRQQRLQREGAHYYFKALIAKAALLLQTADENQYQAGDTELYLFLVQFEKLMVDLWEIAETISQPHALVASQLCDLSRLYLAGEDQPKPTQFAPLLQIIHLLNHDTITMEEAAEADRYLLKNGINTMPAIHNDFVSLYEEPEENEANEFEPL
ncbi:MAG: type II toxin-antitoxin system Phd/YefM family antitoxin [Caldilineaceae bacterium]